MTQIPSPGEQLHRPKPFGDVAHGQGDDVRGGPGRPDVIAAGLAEGLVGVGVIVHDHRETGFQALHVGVEQARLGRARQPLEQADAEESLPRDTEVVARRLVELTEHEVDHTAAVVAHRLEQHLGVEQRVHAGAQQVARLGEELRRPEPVGHVAPGQGDRRRGSPGGAKVIAPGLLENLVVVGQIVDDHRIAGLETVHVPGEQPGLDDARRHRDKTVAEQVFPEQAQVVAGRLVQLAVDEVGDAAGGVPRRLHQHLGVKQRVDTGP